MATTETPIFEHDCDRCIYLGTAAGKEMGWNVPLVDLYYCSAGMVNQHNYLMRFGDDGPEYCFGKLENDPRWPRAQEVYHRALALGLVGEMPEGSDIQRLVIGR